MRIGDVRKMKPKVALQEANHKLYQMEHEKLDPAKVTREAIASNQRTFEAVAAVFYRA